MSIPVISAAGNSIIFRERVSSVVNLNIPSLFLSKINTKLLLVTELCFAMLLYAVLFFTQHFLNQNHTVRQGRTSTKRTCYRYRLRNLLLGYAFSQCSL